MVKFNWFGNHRKWWSCHPNIKSDGSFRTNIRQANTLNSESCQDHLKLIWKQAHESSYFRLSSVSFIISKTSSARDCFISWVFPEITFKLIFEPISIIRFTWMLHSLLRTIYDFIVWSIDCLFKSFRRWVVWN